MRVTVLGKSPSWEDAGGACSGYLVEHEGTRVLLDCGNGVFGKLRLVCDYTRIDAVVISHMHADHFYDLVPFAFALMYAPRQQPVPVARWQGVDAPVHPDLHLPPGGIKAADMATEAVSAPGLVTSGFTTREYEPAKPLTIGSLRVRFCAVPHFIDTWAVELAQSDGARFVYGADCRPNDAIVEFGRDADLLMLEATLPRPERSGVRGHLTPAEAGEHAGRAAAKRLVITHFSDELGSLWARSEAQATFGGPIEAARERATYVV